VPNTARESFIFEDSVPRTASERAPDGAFAAAVLEGLSRKTKRIPCKFLYDARGSELFDRICDLDEYYQTRTEMALLERHAAEYADFAGAGAELVEFGAGALRKVRILLSAFERVHSYVPIDISGDYLRSVAATLQADHPALAIRPVEADFTAPMVLPRPEGAGRRIGFFPGSTIGNFPRSEAVRFLEQAAHLLKGGALLIGVDLVKDPALLHAAYNDREGVTAAFNKNLLLRANRELGADFDPDQFAYYAFYDVSAQNVEMFLVSRTAQRVSLMGRTVAFAKGEAMHTETSCKYTIDGFRRIAAEAGFEPRAVWTDPETLFSLHWLEA